MFSTSDTIVAIATPAGRGGIGVIRLSGPDALEIGRRLIGRHDPLEPRRATFARIVGRDTGDAPIDQVVLTAFPAPQSYTGEDVVEISGHGSPVLLQRVVEAALALGARLAEPGEFTLRAYLNGRIDLVQAEAVADLIDAVTPLQARAAMDQLEGTLTGEIAKVDAALFDLCARLEASLDFPDEGFHFVERDRAVEDVARIADALNQLLRQARAGRVVREGGTVAIVGRPNAGKSSLFNALVGNARAIVTDIPGTTRDLLTERVDLGGVPITLVDTAGLRDAADAIEAEGVDRARQAERAASVVIVVIDGAAALADEDFQLIDRAGPGSNRIVVASKSDLPRAWMDDAIGAPAIPVSPLTGDGMAALREVIVSEVTSAADLRDPPRMSNVRHIALVASARDAAVRAGEALRSGATEELVLIDLIAARQALEEVTGRRTDEDVLRHIFGKFCIGK